MNESIFVLHLKNFPILEQLKLEEALLRVEHNNYCIINEGSPLAVVMGISGKEEELVDLQKVQKDKVPVIKRFSGGGTVVVDKNTFFVSFLFQKDTFDFPPFPEQILNWSANFYKHTLPVPGFSLRENDYTLGNLKCGGNAQYLRKERWLHHTTFLWDYSEKNMTYLLHPKKAPKYREGRSHDAFLCKLKPYIASLDSFATLVKTGLCKNFIVKELTFEKARESLEKEHRKTTHLLEIK